MKSIFNVWTGGAVYCIGLEGTGAVKSPTFINVEFLGNRADIRGGAISADAECHFECQHCVFDSNSCAKKGGAVWLYLYIFLRWMNGLSVIWMTWYIDIPWFWRRSCIQR